MDFSYSDHQLSLLAKVEEYCRRHCAPGAVAESDLRPAFPRSSYVALAEAGILGHWIPKEYGGGGGSFFDALLICETLGKHNAALANLFIVNSVCGTLIDRDGSDEQKRTILPSFVRGKCSMSFAMTEPNAGSDGSAIETQAVADAKGYLLNGLKVYATGALDADYLLLVARTVGNEAPEGGAGLFIVPRNADGLRVSAFDKVAGQSQASCEVVLENVRLSPGGIVGNGRNTWGALGYAMSMERLGVSGVLLGIASASVAEFVEFALQRVQFGRTIVQFQAIQHQIAELSTQVEAMRWLTYRAAWMADRGLECRKEVSMAKTLCVDLGVHIATETMRLVGGSGYLKKSAFNRRWREAALGFYAGGTRELQLNNIARFILA